MSFQAMTWALAQRTGDPGSKAVLMALANYADEDGTCFPGQKRLADETEQGVRTVQRKLELLERLGLIEIETRGKDGGGRTSNRYWLQLTGKPANLTPGANTPERRSEHDTGVANEHATDGAQTASSNPQSLEPSGDAALFAVGAAKTATVEVSEPEGDGLEQVWELFEKAWEAYGRKGSKKVARSRWCAAIDAVLKGRRSVNEKCKQAGVTEPYGYGQLFGEAAAEWLLQRATQYAANRPDRTYRKDMERWLSHEIFATPECDPPSKASTVTSLRYTSDFGEERKPGELPWEGPWDDDAARNGGPYDGGVGESGDGNDPARLGEG